jgi:hypothetical protein
MASFRDNLAGFVSAILRLIGVKKSDESNRQKLLDSWEMKRRSLADEVESLKDDVRGTEVTLRAKSRELAATRGENRPIVEEEIKSLLRELDLKKQKQTVLFSGIDRMNTLSEKLKEIMAAGKGAIDADIMRQLQVDMGSVLMDLKDLDRETARLNSMKYQPATPEPRDYEARKAQAADVPVAAGAATAVPTRLSEAEQQRLARIVDEAN